jgi:vacuolar-type H+-ATPase subunit D/Vma8
VKRATTGRRCNAIEHLQAARTAVKGFKSAEVVKGDSSLNEAARALNKRLKKAVRAAEAANKAWMERVEISAD